MSPERHPRAGGNLRLPGRPDPARALDDALDVELGRTTPDDPSVPPPDDDIRALVEIASALRAELAVRPSPAASTRHRALIARVAGRQQRRRDGVPIP